MKTVLALRQLTLFVVLVSVALASPAASAGADWPAFKSPYERPSRCPGPRDTTNPGPGREHHQVVNGTGSIWQYQAYMSSSFNPPEMQITTNGNPLAPGYIFIQPSDLTPKRATKDTALLIMSDSGQLVWEGPKVIYTNLQKQTFEGKPVITYWNGNATTGANIGHGYGNVTFLDESYNDILTVCPDFNLTTPDNTTFPCNLDVHESFITDRGTLLATAYNTTPYDLSPIGGQKDGWTFDSGFVEIDLRTGKILFSWFPQAHVPVTRTRAPLHGKGMNQSVPLDWFHINSVVNIGDNYLVNGRHVYSAYLIDPKGSIIWHIDGDTGGDFGPLPEGGNFVSVIMNQQWQHHARPHNVTDKSLTISWFNNYNSDFRNGTNATNGLALELTLPPNVDFPPKLVERLERPEEPLMAASQGAYSTTGELPRGSLNQFMGYGDIPVVREYGPATDGSDLRFEGRFGVDNLVQSYRGFKYEWCGKPKTSPSLVVLKDESSKAQTGEAECNGPSNIKGYVSWNGATDVVSWNVYEGDDAQSLAMVGTIGYKGFETEFDVDEKTMYLQAAPVNRDGKEEKRSEVICKG